MGSESRTEEYQRIGARGMSGKKQDRHSSKIEGPFIPVPHALMKCPAWRSLSAVARVLYLEIEFRYNGHNNGRIGLSVRDAAKAVRANKDTVIKAFKDLQRVRLIRVIGRASFDTSKGNRATEWELLRADGKWDVLKWQGPQDDYPVFDGTASHQKQRKRQSENRGPAVRNEGTDGQSSVPLNRTRCPNIGDANSVSSISSVRNRGTHIESAMDGALSGAPGLSSDNRIEVPA